MRNLGGARRSHRRPWFVRLSGVDPSSASDPRGSDPSGLPPVGRRRRVRPSGLCLRWCRTCRRSRLGRFRLEAGSVRFQVQLRRPPGSAGVPPGFQHPGSRICSRCSRWRVSTAPRVDKGGSRRRGRCGSRSSLECWRWFAWVGWGSPTTYTTRRLPQTAAPRCCRGHYLRSFLVDRNDNERPTISVRRSRRCAILELFRSLASSITAAKRNRVGVGWLRSECHVPTTRSSRRRWSCITLDVGGRRARIETVAWIIQSYDNLATGASVARHQSQLSHSAQSK